MTTECTATPIAAPAKGGATLDARVRRELLDIVYSDQPLSLFAAWGFAVAITGIFVDARPHLAPWLWLGAISILLLARFLLARSYRRAPPDPDQRAKWERRFFIGAALTAIAWGFIGWYAYPIASPALRGAIVLLIGGVVAASSRTIACQFPTYCVYTTVSGLPLVARLFAGGEWAAMLLGFFSVLYMLLMIGLGRSFRDTFVRSTRLRFENEELAEQLQRDFAARAAAEAALRASEERLRFAHYALDRAQDLVAIVDREGNFLHVSDAMCRLTGRSADDLAQTKVWTGVVATDAKEFQQRCEEVKRTGAVTFETEVLARDGLRKPIEVNASYVEFNGRETICMIGRDVGPRRAAEKEKMRLQHQLEETQRLESLGVLAGGIAHDFNNLLTAILGNASLARDSLDQPAAIAEMLGQIEIASNQAAGLCRQMLAYAGQGQLVVEALDVSTVVSSTAKLLETTVGCRAELQLQLAAGLPHVLADASQLRQIVINLVHNAAEAMGPSTGRIVVSTYPIRITAELARTARVRSDLPEGDGVALAVVDNGGGMDSQTIEHIFEPFFTTKFTGRGLGLPAVLGIVRSHRALLQVESQVGQGSTFRLVLPAATGPRAVPAPSTSAARRLYGRVLVVDDEETVRGVARHVLQRLGFAVELVASGDAAIAACAENPNRFTLLLIDMTMPGKDGATTLREMRARGATAPAVIMSGFSEQQVRAQMGTQELHGFLPKPFESAALRKKVETALTPSPAPLALDTKAQNVTL